jgi:MlaC protein
LAARAIFDFGEMARRSLARHWEKRTPAEQEEFVRIFTALIHRSYISKGDQHAPGVTYRGETVDADHAVVQTFPSTTDASWRSTTGCTTRATTGGYTTSASRG